MLTETPPTLPTKTDDPPLPFWLWSALGFIVMMNTATVYGTINLYAASFGTVVETTSNLFVSFPPILRLGHAGLWASVFVGVMIGLKRRDRWAKRWVAPLLTLYGISQWLWQAVFARAEFDRGRLVFLAFSTISLLMVAWWFVWQRGWMRR
jgi:hypothetical protein